MTGQQLPFDFAFRPADSAGDFIVSPANEAATAWIDKWPNWSGAGLLLLGPLGSGKTHLARVWQQRANAIYIDNQDALNKALEADTAPLILDKLDTWAHNAERDLFHAYNRAKESNQSLLLCATSAPAYWNLTLPDLLSRLGALPLAWLDEPDDMLLLSLFAKALSARGVTLSPGVIDYIFPRLSRDAASIPALAAALDKFALEAGKGITLPLARVFFAQNSSENPGDSGA